MVKLLVTLLSTILCFSANSIPDLSIGKVSADTKYLQTIMTPYKVRHEKRIIDCILYSSYKYNIPVEIMGRVAEKESGFNWWKINEASGCIGLFQVSPLFWTHLCWVAGSGKYVKILNKHKGTNSLEVLRYIGVNTEAGAIIINDYRKRYGGYSNAFYVYSGYRSRRYRHKKEQAQAYIKFVLQDWN